MRKTTLLIFILLVFFGMVFGRKKSRNVLITGTVVDSMGYFVPFQKVALLNQKGYDRKTMYADAYGIFTYKVKRKNLNRFSICSYSKLGRSKKVILSEFAQNNKITLEMNWYYFNHDYINFSNGQVHVNAATLNRINDGIRCAAYVETSRYPFAFINDDFIRSFFPMVK